MKIIENFANNYPEDPIRYWNFQEYENRANDCVLFIGGWPEPNLIKETFEVSKYFFSTEEQSGPGDSTDQFLPYVDKIFTICPVEVTKRDKRVSTFFPLNKANIPTDFTKDKDVIYTGFVGEGHVATILGTLKNYNYRLVSFANHYGMTTDVATTYQEKLNLIARSKICLTHNQVSSGTPQLKSRIFEAAFCKSLMLVLHDSYNIVEQWFEPNKDFLYYDMNNIKDVIDDALANYENYSNYIENAYQKAINNYTTEKFIEKYIGWKI